MHVDMRRPCSVTQSPQVKEGAEFVSDTDTEVIPKLLHFLYGKVPQPLSFPEVRCWPVARRMCTTPHHHAARL